ncbi:MAG: MFS transporter [Promethearchaeota archaeon]|nr:MAG: MFS transporter [Candidatus Lokiarchaeota archaeon]
MFNNLKSNYNQFPKNFWMVAFTSFIDQLGSFILMPFIALYITARYDIGMTQVGFIFAIVGAGNMIGGILGGALTDKFGRKTMTLFGLLASGSFSIVIIFIDSLTVLYFVILAMGLMGSLAGPARSAMMADILPPEKRTEGFGILRITMNLAATIGPALGGFLAARSFTALFIVDAVSSGITGLLFYFVIPETKPKAAEDAVPETLKQSMGGYKDVLKDWKFMIFVGVSSLMALVYMQMQGTLSVFLRDSHDFSTVNFGYLISLNAFMVVIFQFWLTKRIKKFPALIMMAVGNIIYGIGFGLYGFISTVPLFFVAMAIITVGEMITAPFSQTIAANFAPEDKRGRYMAVMQWTGILPMLFGVIGAGLIMDNWDSRWVWYFAGIFSALAALGFALLHRAIKSSDKKLSVQDSLVVNSQETEAFSMEIPVKFDKDLEISILE